MIINNVLFAESDPPRTRAFSIATVQVNLLPRHFAFSQLEKLHQGGTIHFFLLIITFVEYNILSNPYTIYSTSFKTRNLEAFGLEKSRLDPYSILSPRSRYNGHTCGESPSLSHRGITAQRWHTKPQETSRRKYREKVLIVLSTRISTISPTS